MRIITKLKDIASYAKGTQINGEDLVENGVYEYLNGGITPSGNWNDYNASGGTVTISEGGNSCGYVNYMEKPFWCGAHCYYLYDTVQNARYLYYALKSQQDRLMRIRSGACMPNIKKADLGAFEFYFDTDEGQQQRIVSILQKVERVIAVRQQEIQMLDDLIKARFIEMFYGKGHPEYKLKEVCSKITDGTHKTPKYQESGITFISAKNIIEGKLDFNDVKYITQAEYEEIQKRCKTEPGDVLMAKSGSLGTIAIVETEEPLGLFESLAVLKYHRDRLDGVFLKEQLRSDALQRQLMSGVKGVAVKHLHLNVISEIPVIVPPMDEQKEFAAFVQQSDKSKVKVQQALDKAQILFDSLMQKYFG